MSKTSRRDLVKGALVATLAASNSPGATPDKSAQASPGGSHWERPAK
jgi:hypothetical protein